MAFGLSLLASSAPVLSLFDARTPPIGEPTHRLALWWWSSPLWHLCRHALLSTIPALRAVVCAAIKMDASRRRDTRRDHHHQERRASSLCVRPCVDIGCVRDFFVASSMQFCVPFSPKGIGSIEHKNAFKEKRAVYSYEGEKKKKKKKKKCRAAPREARCVPDGSTITTHYHHHHHPRHAVVLPTQEERRRR